MKYKIISLTVSLLLRLIRLTCRYEVRYKNIADKELISSKQFLLAFFHQDEIALIPYFKNKNIAVLVSLSKDGEIMRKIADTFNYHVVRGSSSRGAIKGLISAIRVVKNGKSFAMAVDGPRGPIFKVKDGICAINKKTDIPIVPARVKYSYVKTFDKSWNKAKLPIPFSKIIINIAPSGNYSKEELENQLLLLNQ